MIENKDWIWMPHAAHLIVGSDCRYHLATKIGDYIVSTLGEYFPDSEIREIFAECRGVKLEGQGDARRHDYMQKIGFEDLHPIGYKYETMVFKAVANDKWPECGCPFVIESGESFDNDAYKTANEAFAGHMAMCNKYANI